MNACHDCEPTHNRDVRTGGRCWCPCHSPVPFESIITTAPPAVDELGDFPVALDRLGPDWERFGLVDAEPCRGCGSHLPLNADGQCTDCTGPTYVRATVVTQVNDADAEELAARLRQLADRLDRTPWPPASPMVLLDPNGNTCGHLTLEPLP